MKAVVALALVGLSLAPRAEEVRSFESRLNAGSKAARTAEGRSYVASLQVAIGNAMRSCALPGKSFIESIGKFSLAADVSASGELSEVLVWPTVPLAECFAASLEKAELPRPPYAPYPLTIESKVRP